MISKTSFRTPKTDYDPRSERLYLAVVHKDWDLAWQLVNEGAPSVYQSAWGRTALHSALFQNQVRKAHPGFFEKLVEASLPVINLATESGNTALHWACTFASENEVSVLLKHGADPTLKNKADLTPLDIATEKQKTEIIQLLKA